ncbi:unnamed protein product [Symbiodinium sp. CCMP2592]|nr:unnamed protein product [Symbiodinium sp. CCMP2592]
MLLGLSLARCLQGGDAGSLARQAVELQDMYTEQSLLDASTSTAHQVVCRAKPRTRDKCKQYVDYDTCVEEGCDWIGFDCLNDGKKGCVNFGKDDCSSDPGCRWVGPT